MVTARDEVGCARGVRVANGQHPKAHGLAPLLVLRGNDVAQPRLRLNSTRVQHEARWQLKHLVSQPGGGRGPLAHRERRRRRCHACLRPVVQPSAYGGVQAVGSHQQRWAQADGLVVCSAHCHDDALVCALCIPRTSKARWRQSVFRRGGASCRFLLLNSGQSIEKQPALGPSLPRK